MAYQCYFEKVNEVAIHGDKTSGVPTLYKTAEQEYFNDTFGSLSEVRVFMENFAGLKQLTEKTFRPNVKADGGKILALNNTGNWQKLYLHMIVKGDRNIIFSDGWMTNGKGCMAGEVLRWEDEVNYKDDFAYERLYTMDIPPELVNEYVDKSKHQLGLKPCLE